MPGNLMPHHGTTNDLQTSIINEEDNEDNYQSRK